MSCAGRGVPAFHMAVSQDEQRVREEAIAWVVQLRAGQVVPEAWQAFERWRAQSPLHARMFQAVSAVWHDRELHRVAVQVALRRAPPIVVRWRGAAHSRWRRRVVMLTAVAIGAVLAAYGVMR